MTAYYSLLALFIVNIPYFYHGMKIEGHSNLSMQFILPGRSEFFLFQGLHIPHFYSLRIFLSSHYIASKWMYFTEHNHAQPWLQAGNGCKEA